MLVKYLINIPQNLHILTEATSYNIAKLELNKECYILVEQSSSALIAAWNKTLKLILILREFVNQGKDNENYTIQEIMTDLDLSKIDLSCIICFQPVPPQEGLILNCCSTIGHKDHIKDWLNQQKICPYCRSKKFKLLDPITHSK